MCLHRGKGIESDARAGPAGFKSFLIRQRKKHTFRCALRWLITVILIQMSDAGFFMNPLLLTRQDS